MQSPPSSEHFNGKSVLEHLKEARIRGARASMEIHGTEMPGHLAAGTDAAKEMAIALLFLWIILSHLLPPSLIWSCLLLFSIGWVIWKTARSAALGWARIERLHRVTEEERWEIEHHRAQEKMELREMYQLKGLSGKLLDDVVDVLMADDNRLLRVMLEEELNLTFEACEHPLKQAFGALIGSLLSACICLLGFWVFPSFGLLLASALMITSSSVFSAKLQRNNAWNTLIWNLAIAGLASGSIYILISLRK